MIKQLSIRNFKSVRQLDLSCRRVNVFIGEPNTGKTNILEAMGLLCAGALWNLAKVARVALPAQLHFNNDLLSPISVSTERRRIKLGIEGNRWLLSEPAAHDGEPSREIAHSESWPQWTEVPGDPEVPVGWPVATALYLFDDAALPEVKSSTALSPPFGQNLASLLLGNRDARQQVAAFLEGTGFKLRIDAGASSIGISREIDDTLISFPYQACSETLRRMIFHYLAINTNSKQALVFDEPEAHAYPPYTKILAEKIALDDRGNQFFITTHSPYMLDSLISKTPAQDLNIILCRMENFETKAYVMTEEQKAQILEWSMDAFFNFDRLLPEME